MPSCAAWGCIGRSDKGDVLKVFPRKDLWRRQIWIERVNRPRWTPSKYSALCERHFDRDQWELPREDGKRKLKATAVPTVFCVEHPSENDVVALEHSYSTVGYRQLYDNFEPGFVERRENFTGEENKISLEDSNPLEHIKVEVDENQNLSPEDVNLENEPWVADSYCEGQSGIEWGEEKQSGEEEEEAENIQCTPDIFLYSRQPDLDPIENVVCEEDVLNTDTNEPSSDPLAITAEDVENVKAVIPHFGQSKKFLFVTKQTKYLTPTHIPVAEGDPLITPPLKLISPSPSKSPSKSVRKVISPTQKSIINKKSTDQQIMVKPELGTTFPCSEYKKVPVHNNKSILDSSLTHDNTSLRPERKVSSPLKLKIVSPNTGKFIEQNLNVVSENGGIGILKTDKGKVVKVISKHKLLQKPSAPDSPINKPLNIKVPRKNKLIKIDNKNNVILSYPSIGQQILIIDSKAPSKPEPKKMIEPSNDFLRNNVVTNPLQKIVLDHEYTNKSTWMSSSVTKEEKVLKLLGNNDIKLWLNQNRKQETNSSTKNTYTLNYGKTKVCPLKTTSQKLDPPKIGAQRKYKLQLYQCAICKLLYSTMATLKIHMAKTHNVKKLICNVHKVNLHNSHNTKTKSLEKGKEKHEIVKNITEGSLIKEEKSKAVLKDSKSTSESCSFKNNMVCIPNLNALKSQNENLVKLSEPTTNNEDSESLKEDDGNNKTGELSVDEKIIKQTKNKIKPKSRKLNVKEPSRIYSLRVKNKSLESVKSTKSPIPKRIKTVASILINKPVMLPKIKLNDVKLKKRPNKRLLTKKHRKVNVKTAHSKEKQTSKQNIKDEKITPRETLKCTSCQKLIEKHSFRSHVKSHAISEFSCSLCFKKFPKSYLLRQHIINEHKAKKSFICPVRSCCKRFESKRMLEKHTRIHKKLQN